ncbi:MAG: hypothetical protein OEN01_14555 [Candidatus Krumholzibacteria bacterium]|nr:hypothetical protein [Candidatus Krumholzibacteria bacterium]
MNRFLSFIAHISVVCVLLFAVAPAHALSILLAGGTMNCVPRLTGLGHTVTVSDETTWGSIFDYSPYDVVAFEFGSTNPTDINRLVAAVDAGQVGVVFFRGAGAEATAIALGLITGLAVFWQTPTDLNVVDNSHCITSHLPLGIINLGYMYMSYVQSPGASTTALATGPDGAALLVHNTRRAAITPYYAHATDHNLENSAGLAITDRTLQWAAGQACTTTPVEQTTWGAVKALYGIDR